MAEGHDIDQSFKDVFHNFAYSIQGYRLFLEHLHDSIATLDEGREKRIGEQIRRIQVGLDRDELQEVGEVLQKLGESFDEDSDAIEADAEPVGLDAEGGAAETEGNSQAQDTRGKQSEADADTDDEGVPEFHLSGRAAAALVKFLDGIRRSWWMGAEAQRRLLYRSVITGLVSQFEVLVADIAHQFYRRAPDALDTSTPVLSLSDLRRIGSVDAAFDLLVEKKTDELLAKSVDDWSSFLSNRMKIDLPSMSRDWEKFHEFIQRRHIIVHAGGRITRRYLDNVDDRVLEEYFTEPEVGTVAELDRAYVDVALDHFEQIGILLCLTAWVKLQRDKLTRMESALQDWVYERLLEKRWKMALAVSSAGVNSKRLSTAAQMVCQMNAWLCLKRLGRLEEVREDIEAFDVSALENRFRIVRLALLDRNDQVLKLIEATEGRDLDYQAWYEWPILEDIRSEPRFAELAGQFAPEKSAAKDGANDAALEEEPDVDGTGEKNDES